MTVTGHCPRCNGLTKLRDGGCPYCLLQQTLGLEVDSAIAAARPFLSPTTAEGTRSTYSQADDDSAGNITATTPKARSSRQAAPTIPGYAILEELGRGGMGVVYKARHQKLGHLVALKMILAGSRADEHDVQRFVTEARAVASLHHPNIVQIYELGEHDGLPYIALEYCEGGSLARRLKEQEDTPVPDGVAAALVQTLACAVHVAHEHKIVHRDLNPANILLAVSSQPSSLSQTDATLTRSVSKGRPSLTLRANVLAECIPKITDFGLAKKLDEEQGHTLSGAVMGTPSYMSPEQAAGAGKHVGPAADVYALGAVLYKLLTGRAPFKGPTAVDTMMQAIKDEPVPPSRLQSRTPRDLETICLKCLHKDPAKRYRTALDLAEDLERWQAGKPIHARPVGPLERGVRWCLRNRAVAGLLLAVILSMLAGTVVSVTFALESKKSEAEAMRREKLEAKARSVASAAQKKAETEEKKALAERNTAVAEYNRAEAEKKRATGLANKLQDALVTVQDSLKKEQAERTKAEFVAYSFRLREAQDKIRRGLFQDGEVALALCDARFRHWEFSYLKRLAMPSQSLLCKNGRGSFACVAFSPDGKRLVACGTDGLTLWDAQTGQWTLSLNGHTLPVRRASFSPDGKRIVSCGGDYRGFGKGEAKVWDAHTGQELLSVTGLAGAVMDVSLSPDGTRLLTASGSQTVGEVTIWDADTGMKIRSLEGLRERVLCARFSPDGKSIATGSTAPKLRLWDAETGQQVREFKGHRGLIHSVAFSPDGTRLASGSYDSAVKIWDVATGDVVHSLKAHPHGTLHVVYSPDGKRLAAAGHESFRVWNTDTVEEVLLVQGHTEWVSCVAFSPDSRKIASASWGYIKIWDERTGQEVHELHGHGGPIQSVNFSDDGKQMVTGGYDHVVRVWDVHTGEVTQTRKGHVAEIASVNFSSDGKRVVSGGGNEIFIWDLRPDQETPIVKASAVGVKTVSFSPDGTLIVCGANTGVTVLDARTGQSMFAIAGGDQAVFSPDGTRLATGGDKGTVHLWDARTRKEVATFTPGGAQYLPTLCLCFSRDGKRLAAAATGINVWEVQSGRHLLTISALRQVARISGVDLSPDGKRLVSAVGKLITIWDVETGQEALSLHGDDHNVYSVRFSPDGKHIAAGGYFGKLKIWQALGP